MARPRIEIPMEKIAAFCRRWKIVEFSLFGSVLRDDFRPESDVDVLASFAADASWGWRDLLRMEEELSRMFGRTVDLVDRKLVEASPNYIRRRHILRSAEALIPPDVPESTDS